MSSADFAPSTSRRGPGPGVRKVLVLGGYGNFGARIVQRLRCIPRLEVVVAGRRGERARRFADSLGLDSCLLDTSRGICGRQLRGLDVDVVVNTAGPFSDHDYTVAEAAIEAGTHYLDIADCRAYVCGISRLDEAARQAGVLVTSGVSSVPALSAAVADSYLGEFRHLRRIHYGITTSELTPGEAAIRSALSCCGAPIVCGSRRPGVGWQGSLWKRFDAPLGWRWLVRFDAPDLALFPERYPDLEDVRFRGGVALLPSMLGVWCLGVLARLGIVRQPEALAPVLTWLGRKLEIFGRGRSGMYMVLEGEDRAGRPRTREWQLIAERNDGPMVPCAGVVALVRKLACEGVAAPGALPCVGLISLQEYLAELRDLAIRVVTKSSAEHSGRALMRMA